MIALDTNVQARAITTELEADAATALQQQQARELLASGQPLFLPVTVIEELERVLRGAYAMPAKAIAAVFEDLLLVEHITVDRAAAVSQALQWYRRGLDFADALPWPNRRRARAWPLSTRALPRRRAGWACSRR